MTTINDETNELFTSATELQLMRESLADAVMAPSSHNSQPWLFRIGNNFVDILADRSRSLPVVDPNDRELIISCGALLGHLSIAIRQRGRELHIDSFPNAKEADLVARVQLGATITTAIHDKHLYAAIPYRRTNRANFEQRQLPHDLLKHCQKVASDWGIDLTLIDDLDQRTEIADLVAEGDRIQFSDKSFRRELSSWVQSRRGASKDGMSGSAFGVPDSLSAAGRLAIRTFDIGDGIAAADRAKIIEGSSVLAIFSSSGDTSLDWLRTGQCLSDVLLNLAAAKATASYLNQAVEVDSLRACLTETANTKGVPQLMLRFGYGPTVPASVRRPPTYTEPL